MPLYGGRDWLTRSQEPYKNLDGQRQDDEKSQRSTSNSPKSRLAAILVAVVVVLIGNIPKDISDSFVAVLPVVGLVLASVFPIIIGVILLQLARRKFRRENLYAEEVPSTEAGSSSPPRQGGRYPAPQYERPSQPEERYTVNTSAGRDYSRIVDSWDIKDPKPPWEL